MRDALKIEADFDAQHSESPQYPAAKAYLSCVRQLAIEGCPAVETLDALSEVYKRAFRRYTTLLQSTKRFGTDSEVFRVFRGDTEKGLFGILSWGVWQSCLARRLPGSPCWYNRFTCRLYASRFLDGCSARATCCTAVKGGGRYMRSRCVTHLSRSS